MIVAVLGATALAALLGLAITRLSGLGASIVTLAMLIVTYAILTNWTGLTGGAEAFYGIPVVTTKGWMLAAVFVVIMIARLFRGSALGLRVQATREDELAAASSGVQVIRSRYLVWVLSAGVTAAGGVLFAHFLGAINPDGFYLELSFLTLAMLVLGACRVSPGPCWAPSS
ncbi:MAG: branched-chain amino acid ABC transporter permease [Thermoleophilia bacterium]|nr:branched-chain amino acid ABC transporter permease [Thermoleophilia bacterium]